MTDISQTEYQTFMLAPGPEDAGVFGEQSSPGLPILVANVAFTGKGTARLMVHTMRISSFSTSVSITLRMFPAISLIGVSVTWSARQTGYQIVFKKLFQNLIYRHYLFNILRIRRP